MAGGGMDSYKHEFDKVLAVFDTVLRDILPSKLKRNGFDGWATQWVMNCQDGHTPELWSKARYPSRDQ